MGERPRSRRHDEGMIPMGRVPWMGVGDETPPRCGTPLTDGEVVAVCERDNTAQAHWDHFHESQGRRWRILIDEMQHWVNLLPLHTASGLPVLLCHDTDDPHEARKWLPGPFPADQWAWCPGDHPRPLAPPLEPDPEIEGTYQRGLSLGGLRRRLSRGGDIDEPPERSTAIVDPVKPFHLVQRLIVVQGEDAIIFLLFSDGSVRWEAMPPQSGRVEVSGA